MPLIIRKNKTKYFHGRSSAKSKGEGFFDSLLSTITSKAVQDAAKEVVVNVGKKAATELGNKASEKVINKIFPPSNPSNISKTQEVKLLAEQLFPRGSGLKNPSIRRV